MPRSRSILVGVVAALLLTGCTGSPQSPTSSGTAAPPTATSTSPLATATPDAATTPTTTPTQPPTVAAPTQSPAGLGLTCDDLLSGPAWQERGLTAALSPVDPATVESPWVEPRDLLFEQQGGVNCRWEAESDYLTVAVLPDATARWGKIAENYGFSDDDRRCSDASSCYADAIVADAWVRIEMTIPELAEEPDALIDDIHTAVSTASRSSSYVARAVTEAPLCKDTLSRKVADHALGARGLKVGSLLDGPAIAPFFDETEKRVLASCGIQGADEAAEPPFLSSVLPDAATSFAESRSRSTADFTTVSIEGARQGHAMSSCSESNGQCVLDILTLDDTWVQYIAYPSSGYYDDIEPLDAITEMATDTVERLQND